MVSIPGDHFGEKLRFEPEVDMMLVFPNWLQNFFDPFFGEGVRIAIAFNVLIANFTIIKEATNS